MTRFVFCAYEEEDAVLDGERLTIVVVSTRETWEGNGYIDDGYEDEDWERLLEVTDTHGLGELMESVYEAPQGVSREQIRDSLEMEVDFAYSGALDRFIRERAMVGVPLDDPLD
jgi:hypothetical protein